MALKQLNDNLEKQVLERTQALAVSEEKYRRLIENSIEAIFVLREGIIVYANSAMLSLFKGREQTLVGTIFIDLVDNSDSERVSESLETARMVKQVQRINEFSMHIQDGQKKWIDMSTVAITWEENPALLNFMADVTEQRNLRGQLLQAQKMEAIGVLAGGIAHDFNNILSVILGFAELSRMETKVDNKSMTYIENIMKAAERASQLTHSLLTFSRTQVMTISEVDLNDLVAKLGKLLVRVIGEDIELRTVRQPNSTPIMADSGQIEQIIMNLVTNARDAMPSGGTLTIVSGLEEVNWFFCNAHGCATPGPYALLAVSDTGIGMDDALKKRIFDPFFTTKELGKGTGLGLATVYGIVRQHKGFLDVESEPGKGSTFRVYLPALEVTSLKKKAVLPPEPVTGGTEAILVAEDDPTVRELLQVVLKSYGYWVILAVDGQDAVEKYSEHKNDISLVILDMIMPKVSGLEALQVIKGMRPEIKVLFLSGYTADKIKEAGIPENVELATKPISPHNLLLTVRNMLDSRANLAVC
ncbi:MAG: ATP-binding protein [Dissulfurispiraceae bacterium]